MTNKLFADIDSHFPSEIANYKIVLHYFLGFDFCYHSKYYIVATYVLTSLSLLKIEQYWYLLVSISKPAYNNMIKIKSYSKLASVIEIVFSMS